MKEIFNLDVPAAQSKTEDEAFFEYFRLLGGYNRLFEKIKNLERRRLGEHDTESNIKIQDLEDKRHNIHLTLLELGKKLNKKESDVLFDIIREEGNLGEMGLPEFSVLQFDDIVSTGDRYQPYNLNLGKAREYRGEFNDYSAEDDQLDGMKVGPIMPEDKCLLVYAVTRMSTDSNGNVIELVSDDMSIKEQRADELAREVKGETLRLVDSWYHTNASAGILGVIINKNELEEVANIIRSNPMKFRFGNEFYTEEAIKKIDSDVKERIIKEINDICSHYSDARVDAKYFKKKFLEEANLNATRSRKVPLEREKEESQEKEEMVENYKGELITLGLKLGMSEKAVLQYAEDEYEGYLMEMIWSSSSRVQEILDDREKKEAIAASLDCSPERISITTEEALTGKIKLHFGELNLQNIQPKSIENLKLPEIISGDLRMNNFKSANNIIFPKEVRGGVYLCNLESIEGLKLPESVEGKIFLFKIPEEKKEELKKAYPGFNFYGF